jgi:hypothetical protein
LGQERTEEGLHCVVEEAVTAVEEHVDGGFVVVRRDEREQDEDGQVVERDLQARVYQIRQLQVVKVIHVQPNIQFYNVD